MKNSLHIFNNMIGLLDGRVYYNLLNWYKMLSYLPGFKKHKESWDQMIGISQRVGFPQHILSPINRVYALAAACWKLLTVRRNANKFFRHFTPAYKRFKKADLSKATEPDLIALYRSASDTILEKWYLTLVNDFAAMKYYDWLKKLCQRWITDQNINLHNDLLCGEAGVESVDPVHSLLLIADIIGADDSYRTLFEQKDGRLIWQRIQREQRFAELKRVLDLHLENYGDRGLEELKLETPTFYENPGSLIELIKGYCSTCISIEELEKREHDIRKKAEAVIGKNLRNPLKKLAFSFVLKKARLAIVNRENMRFARSRVFGIVRRIFIRMANLFVERGLIDSKDDIYYLTLDEVFGIVEGTAMTQNLRVLVEERKKEYEEFSGRDLPQRFQTTGIPYLHSFRGNDSCKYEGKKLVGIGCSAGIAEGTAKVIFDPRSSIEHAQYVLVTISTDPGWVFLMISSRGIIVEKGSVLSHTAIIGRELGIPTIVGAAGATKRIRDGATIRMNGSTGEVQWE